MNYTKISQLAKKMCKQYGALCTIIKTESVYDKEMHSEVETETTYRGYAVVSSYDEKLINGTTILFGDCKVLFTPETPMKVETTDKIKIEDTIYNILNVIPLCPDGKTIVSYELQVRV